MMKIIDRRKPSKEMRFADIEVGGAFLDCNGDVCIKVSPSQWFSFRHNMLLPVDDHSMPYIVVNAEMVITDWGYNDEADIDNIN